VSEREHDRQAELRAERIRWRGRSRSMSLVHRSDTAQTTQMEAGYGGATLYMRAGN
jgi:hypothetical protein